jgi:hypothetical protein
MRTHQRLRVGQRPREHGDGCRRAPVAEPHTYVAGEPCSSGPPHRRAAGERVPRRVVQRRREQINEGRRRRARARPRRPWLDLHAERRLSRCARRERRLGRGLREADRKWAAFLGVVPTHWIRDSAQLRPFPAQDLVRGRSGRLPATGTAARTIMARRGAAAVPGIADHHGSGPRSGRSAGCARTGTTARSADAEERRSRRRHRRPGHGWRRTPAH